MPVDLDAQIRALIEAVSPVTAAEAVGGPAQTGQRQPSLRRVPARRRTRAVALAACVSLVGGTIAWGALGVSHAPAGKADSGGARAILTAEAVRAIAHSSTASSSSGTATVHDVDLENGTPQSSDTIAVTFGGSNIDEKITALSEPPGSAPTFTTDDRLVAGQFYIYTPGPVDVLEWLHDTSSSNDTASMQFPDPRTLYSAMSASADFVIVGTSTIQGMRLTHLRAEDPGAIDTSALGNLAQGTVSSFDLWIGPNDVVEQMAFSSSQTQQSCTITIGSSGSLVKLRAELKTLRSDDIEIRRVQTSGESRYAVVVRLSSRRGPTSAARGESCSPQTSASQVHVMFANLGATETIVAPQGAVDYQGKG